MQNSKFKIQSFIILLLLFLFTVSAVADTIWKDTVSSSPYTPEKSYKLGDIITVVILETSTAKHKAGTDTDIRDDLGIKFTHTINRLYGLIGPDNEIAGQSSNKYKGLGTTQRESLVKAKVAAVVTEILPNGNLKLEGQHKVEVNDEAQEITVKGIVRSKDINFGNSIYSYQVANAEISVRGKGVVQEAEAPGWLTRIINWLF